MTENLKLEEALDTIRRYFKWTYKVTLDELTIEPIQGYWRNKKACGGKDGGCRCHIHGCMFNEGPIYHTVTYYDKDRDEKGRWASPYRTWKTIYDSGIMDPVLGQKLDGEFNKIGTKNVYDSSIFSGGLSSSNIWVKYHNVWDMGNYRKDVRSACYKEVPVCKISGIDCIKPDCQMCTYKLRHEKEYYKKFVQSLI